MFITARPSPFPPAPTHAANAGGLSTEEVLNWRYWRRLDVDFGLYGPQTTLGLLHSLYVVADYLIGWPSDRLPEELELSLIAATSRDLDAALVQHLRQSECHAVMLTMEVGPADCKILCHVRVQLDWPAQGSA